MVFIISTVLKMMMMMMMTSLPPPSVTPHFGLTWAPKTMGWFPAIVILNSDLQDDIQHALLDQGMPPCLLLYFDVDKLP